MLIEAISGLPSIADLAQPELRLAGLRFNPKTNGPSRGRYVTAVSYTHLDVYKRQVANNMIKHKLLTLSCIGHRCHMYVTCLLYTSRCV